MCKRIKTMLRTAEIFAEQSHCKRNKVGAIIAKDNRIISTGYNGALHGLGNCCEDSDGETKFEVAHAEMNAIAFAAKSGISVDNATLFVTLSPCPECAKMIVQSGITSVFYRDEYRLKNGVDILTASGITVAKYEGEL